MRINKRSRRFQEGRWLWDSPEVGRDLTGQGINNQTHHDIRCRMLGQGKNRKDRDEDALLDPGDYFEKPCQALTLGLWVQWPGGPVYLKTYWPPKKLTGPVGQ